MLEEPGNRGAISPPDLGRSLSPIPTRWARLCPPQFFSPPTPTRNFRPSYGSVSIIPLRDRQPAFVTATIWLHLPWNNSNPGEKVTLDFFSSLGWQHYVCICKNHAFIVHTPHVSFKGVSVKEARIVFVARTERIITNSFFFQFSRLKVS